jgi:cytochrome c biogenesis protein CcmG, thiol:disulfide interchange protein DsbE
MKSQETIYKPLYLKVIPLYILLIIFSYKTSLSQNKYLLDFSLQNTDGETISLTSFLEKGPVYINFWATWCIPCKSELKALHPLFHTYKDSNFSFISINIDNTKSLAKVKAFVKAQKYEIPVFLDPNSEILEKLNGKYLPYSVLLNSKGEIVKVRTGYIPGDEKEIEKDIIDILNNRLTGLK